MVVFIFLSADLVKKTNGMEWHYSNNILTVLNDEKDNNPYECQDNDKRNNDKLLQCNIGNQANIRAVIVGDSHAEALTIAAAAVLDLKKEGFVSIIKAACPFILNAKKN